MSDKTIEEDELGYGLPTSIEILTDMQQTDIALIEDEMQCLHVENEAYYML